MKLTPKENTILAGLYDTETYRIFRKHFMEQRQIEIAKATPFKEDIKEVFMDRGRIMELLYMDKELRQLNAKATKKDKK